MTRPAKAIEAAAAGETGTGSTVGESAVPPCGIRPEHSCTTHHQERRSA